MWSRQLKPITSTERRETPRFEYHVAGMVRVQMDEHTELQLIGADATALSSGRNARVAGNKAVVVAW
jgi:hypothetical protein